MITIGSNYFQNRERLIGLIGEGHLTVKSVQLSIRGCYFHRGKDEVKHEVIDRTEGSDKDGRKAHYPICGDCLERFQ